MNRTISFYRSAAGDVRLFTSACDHGLRDNDDPTGDKAAQRLFWELNRILNPPAQPCPLCGETVHDGGCVVEEARGDGCHEERPVREDGL